MALSLTKQETETQTDKENKKMKSWSRWTVATLTILTLTAVGFTQESKSAENMPMDKAFVNKVAEINLAEIELGTLAQKKGNEAVKQFGKLMVSDHSDAQNAVKQLASEQGVTIPEKPGKGVFDLKAQLSHMSTAHFDKDYIQHMVQGHNGAVAMIENEIENGQNPAIKAFAEKILPTVQDHLRIAENVAGRMGMSGKVGLSQPDKAIPVASHPM